MPKGPQGKLPTCWRIAARSRSVLSGNCSADRGVFALEGFRDMRAAAWGNARSNQDLIHRGQQVEPVGEPRRRSP
jgi:hypothetical protein